MACTIQYWGSLYILGSLGFVIHPQILNLENLFCLQPCSTCSMCKQSMIVANYTRVATYAQKNVLGVVYFSDNMKEGKEKFYSNFNLPTS